MTIRRDTAADRFCRQIRNRLHAAGMKRSEHVLDFQNQTGLGDLEGWPDDRTDGVWIETIEAVRRGEGVGRRMMSTICGFADECGATLLLNPCASADGALDQKQLEAWYARLGFTTFRWHVLQRTPRTAIAIAA